MSFLENEMSFDVRDLNNIIEEIEKRRNFIKNYFYIYKKKKIPIWKDWLNGIKNWVNIRDLYTFNHNMPRLEMIISKSYIPQILKIESFISFFFNLKNKILTSNFEFNQFIKSYIEAFEHLDLEDNDLIEKFKNFSQYLIELIRKRLQEEISYESIINYISFLKLFFPLINLGKFGKEEFLQFFSIFDEFPIEYDLIEKYQILIDYYNEIENNLDNVKNLIFHFLKTHKRKEIYDIYYPDPIKFCEYLENQFKIKQRNFVFNTYLEFYKKYTTNFIPPLFLQKKSLNNAKILKIIYKNFLTERFSNRDLEKFFKRILKTKPKKDNFNLYCLTISGLKAQNFPFNFYKIYKAKNLALSEKFTLISSIVSFIPDFYRNRWHPASHTYLISKKKYLRNEKNFEAYFKLILKLENYSDFREFCFKLSLDKKDLRKNFMDITEHSRKKLLKKVENILYIEEFSLLRRLRNIINSEFYNVYKLNNCDSLDEYILKELNSDSNQLKVFLFEQFIRVARKYDDHITGKKLFLEFQNFIKTINNDDKTINDYFYEFFHEDYNENYSIEFNHFYTLIKSKDKKALQDFINELIKNEENKMIKNHEKLGLLYFLQGDFQNSCNSIENAISDWDKIKLYEKNLTNRDEKQNNLINFRKIISIEQNLKNYGSILDLFKDLEQPLSYLKNNKNKYIGYFLNFEILKHYHNIYCFLNLIHYFDENIIENKKRLFSILDYLYTDSKFCSAWNDIVKLWKNKIIPEYQEENSLKFAEENYEIFNTNPLFNGLRVFLENIQQPESYLYSLFNFDRENLIHIFKEKYQLLNDIFNKKFQDPLFLPLNFEDIEQFNNLHIPFKDTRKDFTFFILNLSNAVSEAINLGFLKSKLVLKKRIKGRINLLAKFIEEKFSKDKKKVEDLIFGFRELNQIRSEGGVAHPKHRDYKKKIVKKYSLQSLSKIDISKKIVSDLIISFNNLIEILE